jgi:hypothetical protein
MISQEYLDTLETLEDRCLDMAYIKYDLDGVLTDIQYTWKHLQSRYRITVTQGFDTYLDSTKSTLLDLATLSYELLARLTNAEFFELIAGAKELHKAKNAGYSGDNPDPWANFRECEKFGIRAIDGVMTRLCDKVVRFNNVYKNSSLDQVGESAIDTLRDLAAYSLIAYCLLGEME